jgi:hypothetical protein
VPESDPKISQSGSANPANAVQGEGIMQVTLSATIGDRISEVNEAQREYDQQLAKVGSIREQVYADWYKYMLATYVLINPDQRLRLSQLWWVKCILRYISQERGGGTNHKDTKDTKIDQSYVN